MRNNYKYENLKDLEEILEKLKNGGCVTSEDANKILESIGCDLEVYQGSGTDSVLFLLSMELLVDKFKNDREQKGYWL